MLEALPSGNSTQNGALEEQLTDLFKLRSSMTKEQFDATPFGASVKKILHLIEGVMMPQVQEAHEVNQEQLFRTDSDLIKCGSVKNSSVQGANLKKAKYERLSPLHATCRLGEAGSYTEKTTCWEEEADKKKIMELKCQAFDMVKKTVGNQQANKQIMVKAGGESTESYVQRIAATVCGKCAGKGCKLVPEDADADLDPGAKPKKCGYDPYTCGCGFMCKFDKAKDACDLATKEWQHQDKKCKASDKQYRGKRAECDSLQDQMDDSACHRAVDMKDACESYEECHFTKKKAYQSLEKMVKSEEIDRKAEWKGLKRMRCLIAAFANKKVNNDEIEKCKNTVNPTDHLNVTYPAVPHLDKCEVPHLYPNTPSYKIANFAPLPALAKGKEDAYECAGLKEISTIPADGSPKECKCERITLNGPYGPGSMVKCSDCLDVRRSLEKNSCPDGTKLFAPRTRSDWKTFLSSAEPLRAPNFIIDITRPQKGCGGCGRHAMNSHVAAQYSWKTSDGAPWWLRSTRNNEPNGDYQANCYMDMWNARDENDVTFNDGNCAYHAKSYYCQSMQISTRPKAGSPRGCVCKLVALTGKYSAGSLLKCVGCLRVSRSTQKNSCPRGTKLFSPRSRADWKTFIASATALRSPHWIIDVTQPQNGCGGCTRNAMNSRNPAQATWMTTDRTAWYLRSSKYSEPNGDYHANCYMNLGTTANENSVTFQDHNCNYNSNAYYCQTAKVKKVDLPPPPEEEMEPEEPPKPEAIKAVARCQFLAAAIKGSIKGKNIGKAHNNKTLAECQALCSAESDCKSIDYSASKSRCYLGSCQLGDKGCKNSNDEAYTVHNCEAAARCQFLAAPIKGSIKGKNIGKAHNDKTLAECQALCSAESDCKSIDYSASKSRCYLGKCQLGDKGCKNSNDKAYTVHNCEAGEKDEKKEEKANFFVRKNDDDDVEDDDAALKQHDDDDDDA